ncbi:cyclic nucleotide-binding domain-containing thioredoxin-disulfide reductase [Lentzea sp. HUAS12]|uniref:FAD-dependent oxidoreductase n=1 Tax=Lentzea sp. HUAS12 TaxID=2951806 RepID=UPI00209F57B6|nr:cyclic nucleotide-binding domain-containing thioredoxin-disulfide reductase [Lentzea sp. HUAS12]USX53786.1 FAD-dependent oxidoreductase [Lentzea sp. HUAS12]
MPTRLSSDLPVQETPDENGAFPRLDDDQIDQFARYGTRRATQEDEVLYAEGDRNHDFFVIVSGLVQVLEHGEVVRVHGPGRFLGELGLLEGQPSFVTAVAAQPGEVVQLTADQLNELVRNDPVLGDLVLRAYLMRRAVLIGRGNGLQIIGSCFSPDTKRLLEFAARNRVPHRLVDTDRDVHAEEVLRRFGVTIDETPLVVVPGGGTLRNPSSRKLAQALGLHAHPPPRNLTDLLVVGAGPGGLAAVVYGAADGLDVVAVDSVAAGGQAGTTSRIENYLGFPAGISGPDLAERAVLQAEKFGVPVHVSVEAVEFSSRDGHYVVSFDDSSQVRTRSLVIATGARYRKLDLPRLADFESTDVYYAATIHEARACEASPVAIVGGGNSAGQAAVFLADRVPHVHLVVRGDDLNKDMSRYLVDRVTSHPRIEVLLRHEVVELLGGDKLDGVVVQDNRNRERRTLPVRGLFVFIGATPCTAWLSSLIAVDEDGFVLTGQHVATDDTWWQKGRRPFPLETNRPGVFAIGDVRSGSIKRVGSAVGEGAMVVRLVHDHLSFGARR